MRCYNGCPDDELAAIWASRDNARKEARELGYCITYFPIQAQYAAARLTDWAEAGPFCNTPEECLVHVKEHANAIAIRSA